MKKNFHVYHAFSRQISGPIARVLRKKKFARFPKLKIFWIYVHAWDWEC